MSGPLSAISSRSGGGELGIDLVGVEVDNRHAKIVGPEEEVGLGDPGLLCRLAGGEEAELEPLESEEEARLLLDLLGSLASYPQQLVVVGDSEGPHSSILH